MAALPSPPTKPSTAVAAFAAVPALLFPVVTLIAMVVLAEGAAFRYLVEEGGMFSYVVLAGSMFAAVVTAALAFVAGKGLRAPLAVAFFVAALPWLAGLAGMRLGNARAASAIENADASYRATMMAQGIAEASVLRYFGTALAASLFGAVAVGWAIASLGQRAPKTKPLLALPFAALGFLGMGLMVVLMWENARGGTLLVALSGLGAVIALALGAAGAGGDVPHGRAAALAAGAGVAAAFGCVAAIEAVETRGIMLAFGAVANADASMRPVLLASGASEMIAASRAGLIGGIALAVAAVALTAWAMTRGKPSGGRIAGAAALVLTGIMVVALDAVAMSGVGEDMKRIAAPPWSDVPGWSPLTITGDGRLPEVDALVAPDHVIVIATGARVAPPDARAPLVEAFRAALQRSYDADDADATRGLTLALAVDARVPAPLFRNVLLAAREAGAGAIRLVGAPPSSPETDAARAELMEDAPLVAALFHPISTVAFALERSTNAAPDPPADPNLFHATIDATSPVVSVATRPGSPEPAFTIDTTAPAEHPASWDRPPEEEWRRVYLAFGDDVTMARIALLVDHVVALGKIPVVVAGPLPGEPSARLLGTLVGDEIGESFGFGGLGAHGTGEGGGMGEGTVGLGNLGAIGVGSSTDPRVRTGAAEVRGSLSPDVIRRIVRRHINEVRFCYEQALAPDPTLEGRIEVRFVIAASGTVHSSELASSTLRAPVCEACVVSAVRRWIFPAPEGGGIVIVKYPFTFGGE